MGLVSIQKLSVLSDKTTHLATISASVLYLAGDVNNPSFDILGSVRGMNLCAHMNDASEITRFHAVALSETDRMKKEAEEFQTATKSVEINQKLQSDMDKIPALSQAISEDYDLIQKGSLSALDTLSKDKLSP